MHHGMPSVKAMGTKPIAHHFIKPLYTPQLYTFLYTCLTLKPLFNPRLMQIIYPASLVFPSFYLSFTFAYSLHHPVFFILTHLYYL